MIYRRGRGGGGRRAPPPAPRRAPPPPARAGNAPAPAQQSAGGGFLSTMVQGFAFGTGSSMAREAVHSVMGGGQQAPQQEMHAPAPAQQMGQQACAIDNEALMQCLQQNAGNAGACQFYFDALQSCQSSSA